MGNTSDCLYRAASFFVTSLQTHNAGPRELFRRSPIVAGAAVIAGIFACRRAPTPTSTTVSPTVGATLQSVRDPWLSPRARGAGVREKSIEDIGPDEIRVGTDTEAVNTNA